MSLCRRILQRHKLLTAQLMFVRHLLQDRSLWPKQQLKPADNVTWKTWGFHSPAAKDSRILGCDTAPFGTSLPLFWRILPPSSPKVKHTLTPLKKITQWSSKTGGITHQRQGVVPHSTWILNHLNHFSLEGDKGSDNKYSTLISYQYLWLTEYLHIIHSSHILLFYYVSTFV
jgi:hypothetical protein